MQTHQNDPEEPKNGSGHSLLCVLFSGSFPINVPNFRMKGKKDKEQREAAKELEHSIHIVKAPAALNKELSLIPPAKVPVTEKQSEENRMEE
ncbi:hypothetical protein T459_26658 [Capsicum annuum]|uniref:Uncharacterized protein n=1 Tax=Capsicum annuum TaxID=4072 RepID=A0A2G2YPB7_CAPAN|nr:hypothetical protein T459_26658 [Capsicum annuum]